MPISILAQIFSFQYGGARDGGAGGAWARRGVERLNEHLLEDCLGRQRTIAIYIMGG
jgi:hypothetical protein